MTSPIPKDRRAAILQDAIARISNGETTNHIARSYGLDGSTIRGWLLADASNDADLARATYLANDLADRQQAIDDAADTITLARAREAFRAAAWLAERRCPSLFGAKVETTVRHDISDDLRMISERRRSQVIDVQGIRESEGGDGRSMLSAPKPEETRRVPIQPPPESEVSPHPVPDVPVPQNFVQKF